MGQKIEDIVINRDDVKIRKKYAPPTKIHNPKKVYTRKPKHGDEELEEELDRYYSGEYYESKNM